MNLVQVSFPLFINQFGVIRGMRYSDWPYLNDMLTLKATDLGQCDWQFLLETQVDDKGAVPEGTSGFHQMKV